MSNQKPTIESRFEGSLLGLAVGDALGATFEGKPADVIAREYATIKELIENPPPGELCYTDDTQMTIGVAESLIKCQRVNERELCKRFAENYLPQRGYGAGASLVIEAMIQGQDYKTLAANHFPGGSFGNGAAMRVAPVGLLFRHDPKLLWKQARLSALPTHVHPLGIEGAQVLALAVGLASNLDEFDRTDFFARLSDRCNSLEYSGPLERAAKLTYAKDLCLFGNGIEATSSVVTAIAAFGLSPYSYEETIGNAILLGGDTDTIAAMAGAISGAYLGSEAIPIHLLDNLEDRKQGRTYLETLAGKLCDTHEKMIENKTQENVNQQKHKKISKSLSYVLRHRPETVEIELEEGGWVDVEKLIVAFNNNNKPLSIELLREVVAENDKQRFEFSEDESLIRARQGHSAEVDLGYEPADPPETLYHGSATRNLEAILEMGLIKGDRHHVHMSTNKETMTQAAMRHGKPVLLAIDAKQMHVDGHEFFVTGNDVWLTDYVPAGYLTCVD